MTTFWKSIIAQHISYLGQIKEQIFCKNFRKSTVSFSKGGAIERALWCIYKECAELIMPLGHVWFSLGRWLSTKPQLTHSATVRWGKQSEE